ncbi:MAG: cupredoxin domain-containing protein [Gammaproteobacteria bacterium]|nr:cupredoxin domain-containing protein [Gammaproteobacteria bacterium]MDH5303737.1 cupredoxin domain-containing protein [Gammaproteobacteria bacterium]MDH5322987.1 cupredoxin domain-containing protein [Gammaproteobacteria bacterium]
MLKSDSRPGARCWLISIALGLAVAAHAATPEFEIEIRNHLFEPDVLVIPAHTKVKLIVFNRDPTPEEFESFELNREKVIMGGSKAIIFIGPLPPGEYPFFGEFNPATALGRIVVQDDGDAG